MSKRMKTSLRHKQVWGRLTSLAKKTRGDVAVAYFGQGGAAQLPLKPGSRLVVNLSMATVKAGITDPRELLKLIKNRVVVHTVENLHAKVYVFGSIALIGSPNVSKTSAKRLVETALETDHPGQVAACRDFVLSQLGDEVTKERAETFVPYWKPPKHPAATGAKQPAGAHPEHRRTWVVHVFDRDYDEADEGNAKDERPAAKDRLKKGDVLAEFVSEGGRFAREVELDDIIVEVLRKGPSGDVLPAAHVVGVRRYWVGRERRVVVFTAVPNSQPVVEMKVVVARLGRASAAISGRDGYVKQIVGADVVHRLLNAIARGPD